MKNINESNKYSEYTIKNITYKIIESVDSININIYNDSLKRSIYNVEYQTMLDVTPEDFIKELCYSNSCPINMDLVVIIKIIKKVIPNINPSWAGEYYISLLKEREYTEYFS